jgi:hypothetical protein
MLGIALSIANVTHMGFVTGESFANIGDLPTRIPAVPPNKWENIMTSKTKIAANGDKIYSEGCVTLEFISPGIGIIYGSAITTGGTGRFEGCTGYVDVSGTFNLKTGIKEYTVDGKIKY